MRAKTLTRSSPRCGRATRSARTPSSCTPGSAKTGEVEAGDQARGQGDREALAESETLPAAPREHRGRGRHARALLPGARRAARGRGRRRRAWASAWTPATCSPRASTSARPEALTRGARRLRRRSSAWTASARCTSTTPRRRWAPTATATPTSARASSAPTAARCSSPSRASTACRASSRRPGRTARADAGAVAAGQGRFAERGLGSDGERRRERPERRRATRHVASTGLQRTGPLGREGGTPPRPRSRVRPPPPVQR